MNGQILKDDQRHGAIVEQRAGQMTIRTAILVDVTVGGKDDQIDRLVLDQMLHRGQYMLPARDPDLGLGVETPAQLLKIALRLLPVAFDDAEEPLSDSEVAEDDDAVAD